MHELLDCRGKTLDLSTPRVMGVLNITPDSFSDGGRYTDVEYAVEHAHRMVEAGANIIDIGGESTRPGATAVSVQQEIDRVIPVIEALGHINLDAAISVDTSKAEVMQAAIDSGVGLINDVRALREPGALEVVAKTNVPVCLMHMKGEPRSMQENPEYVDVVSEVLDFLDNRVWTCEQHGIVRKRLLIDPGFGFGKTLDHNLSLLKHLDRFHKLGLPVVAGISRKSMIGTILNKPVEHRLFGSVAGAILAVIHGAHIIRVHDVAETVDAIKVFNAVNQAK